MPAAIETTSAPPSAGDKRSHDRVDDLRLDREQHEVRRQRVLSALDDARLTPSAARASLRALARARRR